MTSRTTSSDVPYSAAQMFDLVADVEKYPEFLPWCIALRILDRDISEAGGKLRAEMIVSYKVFRERFKSDVSLDAVNKEIDVYYLDGPFRRLHNQWRFEDKADGGSTIHFFIAFEFRNILLQSTARVVFEKAFARMSEAFVDRADDLYGGAQ
ncbi:MAG: type II toxin-antitoxin system RatA family toxin [Alphaproteobacteria bacterium]|nr:type II toxin-antitoxin system RatA family toxin [Alphaproteobacteria bacterium]